MIELPNPYLNGDYGRSMLDRMIGTYITFHQDNMCASDIIAIYSCRCNGISCSECRELARLVNLTIDDNTCPSCGRQMDAYLTDAGCQCGLLIHKCTDCIGRTHITSAAIVSDRVKLMFREAQSEEDVI